MPKLKCASNYSNQYASYKAGDEFEASDNLASFLMADSPSSFEVVKAMKEPPANKAILEAPRDKALTDIDGIGTATAKRLKSLGFGSVAAVAQANAAKLATVPGVSLERAEEWIAAAQELVDAS